jgi:hypothetical protein
MLYALGSLRESRLNLGKPVQKGSILDHDPVTELDPVH